MQDNVKNAINEYISNECNTITYIANKYHISRKTLKKYLINNNIKLHTNIRGTIKEIKYREAKEYYINNNIGINKTAKLFGISSKSFSLYLHANNVRTINYMQHFCVNEHYFDIIDTEEKAYWFGFIMADGCVINKNNNYALYIELNNQDANHLLKFKYAINYNGNIHEHKNRNASYILIARKTIVQALCNLGCIPNKTYSCSIDITKLNNYIFDFIRGYLDGDGYISKFNPLKPNVHKIILTIKSNNMADLFYNLLAKYHPYKFVNCNCNRISIERKKDFFNFLFDIYNNANVYLSRKYMTYLEWNVPTNIEQL